MFQLKLVFSTENNRLPLNMDKALVSFVKSAAQAYSEEFFQDLYNKNKSIIKKYTFSCNFTGAKFTKEHIELEGNGFSMAFSSCELEEIMKFYNGFYKLLFQKRPLNKNSMTLQSIAMLPVNDIRENTIIIKMLSSLIVRRHNSETNQDEYFTFEDTEFEDVLKENVQTFLERTRLEVSASDFSILPVKAKKVVVRVFGRPTDASIGVFRLTGTPELLNLLYLAGMGTRRSEAHGKFEILA